MNVYFPIFQELFSDSPYSFIRLSDNDEVLEICLLGKSGLKIRFLFDSHLCYRKLDEGDALRTLSQISPEGLAGRYFYLVENSDFVEWFIDQSYGVREIGVVEHYLICSENDIIDVLSLNPPEVSVC